MMVGQLSRYSAAQYIEFTIESVRFPQKISRLQYAVDIIGGAWYNADKNIKDTHEPESEGEPCRRKKP